MYLPLKNPQKTQTTHAFFAACVVILFALAFCVGAFLFYGSLWGIGHALFSLLSMAWQEDKFIFLCILFLLVFFPFLAISGIVNHIKNRAKWKRSDFIYALDFQPSDVILVSGRPTPLAYSQTNCTLTIHIKKVRQGKHHYVPKVYCVSVYLNPAEPAAVAPGQRAQKLDHLCALKDIFKLFDFQPLFHQFTYTFDLQNNDTPTKNYRAFVEQQIQNHLKYGVHLNYTGAEMAQMVIFNILIIGMLAAFSLPFLLRSTGGIFLAGIILGVIMISPFYFRFCVKPILTYFKDRRTLKRFGTLK